jgi:hypothetical protein
LVANLMQDETFYLFENRSGLVQQARGSKHLKAASHADVSRI